MKNKETPVLSPDKENSIDAVKLMRDIRDKMSKEMDGMSLAEIQAYFNKRKQNFLAKSVVKNKTAKAANQ